MSRYERSMFDWRVWYDAQVGLWKCVRWDDKGGMIVAKSLEMSAVRICTVGQYMRVFGEAKIGTANVFTNALVECDVLRLVPLSQEVNVPAISASGEAIL